MTFQSRDGSSIKGLLDLLRSAQDTPSTPADASTPQPYGAGRTLSRTPSDKVLGSPTQRRMSGNTAHARRHSQTTASQAAQIPSAGQLNDLLRSLGATPNVPNHRDDNAEAGPSQPKSRTLIEPFGPIGALSRPNVNPTRSSGSDEALPHRSSAGDVRPGPSRDGSGTSVAKPRLSASDPKGKGPVRDASWDTMPFSKALPIITELLEQNGFIGELRKMKADQDALERRMWAKSEKIKADHERTIKAEMDIVRLTKRPISPAKKAQWATTLQLAQTDFLRQTCLPSTDSLARRHKDRLKELGMPGLGRSRPPPRPNGQGQLEDVELDGDVEDPEVERARVRKIMDVIQAVLEE